MPKINRLTIFKIQEDAAIQAAIEKYSTLSQDAKKVSVDASSHLLYVYRKTYMDLVGRPQRQRWNLQRYAGASISSHIPTTSRLA